MLKRLAAVLLMGAVYFTSALAWPSPAGAQVISSRQAVCDPQYPTRCIKPAADGSIAVTGGGGGGGGASATAAASGTVPVIAGTNKPQAIDLFSSTSVIVKDGTGTPVDWTAAVPVTGTFWQATQPVSAAALPLPTGSATAAKQPALGTAGASSADVISVQGISGGTALPVSGTVTANLGTLGTLKNAQADAIAGTTGVAGMARVETGTGSIYADDTLNYPVIDVYGNARAAAFTSLGTAVNYQATSADNLATASGASNQVVNAVLRGLDSSGTLDRIPGDTAGLVNQPYALRASRWNYAAASGGISNTTTAVAFKAAAAASTKNCITNIQINATALGAATELAVRDGAGGTVLWRTQIGTAGIVGTDNITLTSAICGSDATLMEVVTLTASVTGAVYFNAQGYTGP